jgi:hypothetical protein
MLNVYVFSQTSLLYYIYVYILLFNYKLNNKILLCLTENLYNYHFFQIL